jgi:ATP-dependent Clp protease ATP-binding subunit ClpC
MFERYTEKARRAFFFARYEASQFGAPQIEAEHILLGLLREDKDLIARYLAHYSASLDRIRKEIESRDVPRKHVLSDIDLPLSEESKQALAFAAEESEILKNRYIGTEHLLLGLLRKSGTVAFDILTGFGVQIDDLRDAIKADQTRVDNAIKGEYSHLDEKWSQIVLKSCLDQGLITMPELVDQSEQVAGLRQFPANVEALMRILAAKGVADPQHLGALAEELRVQRKLKEFIEKLKQHSPE